MDSGQYRTASGLALIAMGTATILGFLAAASQYPGYSAITQTISALGASASPPGSTVIFNSVMILAGLLVLGAAYGIYRAEAAPLVGGVLAVTATVGLLGVGLFPAETGLPHTVAAAVSFGGVGITALLVARRIQGGFAVASATLGVLELLAFVGFATLQGGTPLGLGGLERVVAYLGILWVVAFGAVLLTSESELF